MYHIISNVKGENSSENNIGSKASNLIKLKELGFNVPDFFIISSDVNDISLIKESVYECFDNLGGGLVAVRSSAIGEDGVNKSFAGQYKTILSVSKDNLISVIGECRESLNTNHALSYSKGNIINKMAVIIQKMIYPDISGVSFSIDPVNNDRKIIIVESVNGLCDSLVSGFVNPDHYIIVKDKIEKSNVPSSIKKVAEITKELELKNKYCVDIEWAIQDNILYILQLRPITTFRD